LKLSDVMRSIAPEIHGGKSMAYTLKLPPKSGPLMQFVHYGVQPAVLIKNVFDTKKSINTLHDMSPDKLQQMGFSKDESDKMYKKQRGAVAGKLVGDAASWALYPLALKNPLLHYPVTVGGGVLAPRLGEWLGKAVSS